MNFILARTITGIGVGADLALVNTYISELAPNQGRVKYTSLIFIYPKNLPLQAGSPPTA